MVTGAQGAGDAGAPVPLGPEHEAAFRAYIQASILLFRAMDLQMRADGGFGLTIYDALVVLSDMPDKRMRMKDIASERGFVYSASGVTRVVDTLEKLGFARREVDPSDRRSFFVTLTPEGQAAIERMWPLHVTHVNEHFTKHVSPEQAAVLTSVFGAITAGLATD